MNIRQLNHEEYDKAVALSLDVFMYSLVSLDIFPSAEQPTLTPTD